MTEMISIRYFFLAIAVSQGAMPTNNDENAVEFNIFCLIRNMAASPELAQSGDSQKAAAADIAWQDIQAAFAMTANETFYNKGPQKASTSTGTGKAENDKYDDQWTKTIRPGLVRKIDVNGKQAPKYVRVSDKSQPAAERAKFDHIMAEATAAHASLTDSKSKAAEKEKEAKAAAKRALYGQGEDVETPGAGANKEKAFQANYAAACKGDTGPGLTLASDMACLCSEATVGTPANAAKRCNSDDADFARTNLIYSNTATALAAYQTVSKLCAKQTPHPKLTPANIDYLIALFSSRLGAKADKGQTGQRYIYGTAKTGSNDGCAGQNTQNDNCVNYKAKLGNGGANAKGLTAIQWIQELTSARSAIEAAKKQREQADTAAEKLLRLHQAADLLYEEAANRASDSKAQNEQGGAGQSQTSKANCEQHHASPDNCTAANCRYDKDAKDGSKCKPKPVTETAAPGTGTGDKKDGDKKDEVCTGAEEKDCDKNKCTWDKEKTQCKIKEGSFIISAVIKATLLFEFLILA
uniref:Variant surface glycoprotein 369 n=2 Tax=Trypanosoma brucei TaxID=5691 RepID=M4TD37_9TRYP|nr:variant surface glycoprotein 369 [Trypanosoma brucei]